MSHRHQIFTAWLLSFRAQWTRRGAAPGRLDCITNAAAGATLNEDCNHFNHRLAEGGGRRGGGLETGSGVVGEVGKAWFEGELTAGGINRGRVVDEGNCETL